MSTVAIGNVRKAYGQQEVIHGVSVDIGDGEFVALVGPSGCGKSTLLRMVAGLEEISGGEIAIGDRIVNDVAPKDRDIAMVFQNYALYPHMNVRDNMGFALRQRRTPRAEIEARVNQAARILGLEQLLERKPGPCRRPAAACRDGSRDRAQSDSSCSTNPVEPGCQARVQMRSELKGFTSASVRRFMSPTTRSKQ
jgi:multiple sugar transport system ATP-binding protein